MQVSQLNYPDISVKVIAHSMNANNDVEAITYELEYPRYIHGELLTHRVFSRNSQSSRAVPVASVYEINKYYVKPIYFGKNKAGMSSVDELDPDSRAKAEAIWDEIAQASFRASEELSKLGLHKQWANRITEPYSKIKTVLTTTELSNFFNLRTENVVVMPELEYLALKMQQAYKDSKPNYLGTNEWHLPYVTQEDLDNYNITTCVKISASCCAQVSYRKLDNSVDKALDVYHKLVNSGTLHGSPFEHQLKVYDPSEIGIRFDAEGALIEIPDGITHTVFNTEFEDQSYFSGNIRGFVQFRQLLANLDSRNLVFMG